MTEKIRTVLYPCSLSTGSESKDDQKSKTHRITLDSSSFFH